MVGIDQQQTIKKVISYTGIALHTGENVTMTCFPAPEDTGICFRRVDLASKPMIKVKAANITSTKRCTTIGCVEEDWFIHTIEHLMAAISMSGIDNLIVELDAEEPPVTDGSASVFMNLFQDAGIERQTQPRRMIKIIEPIYLSDKDATLVALPFAGLRISYTLSYDHQFVGTQYFDFDINKNNFLSEIAAARTFGFAKEAEYLHKHGLALGGGVDNAVLITDDGTVNPLRFPDEFARHKVLDLIGDLAVNGRVSGHFIGIKSGHKLNAELSKRICLQQGGLEC